MSVSLLFSDCAATLTVPVCCGVDPHCAQNGLLEAAGGVGGRDGADEPPPHAPSESISRASVSTAGQTETIRRIRIHMATLQNALESITGLERFWNLPGQRNILFRSVLLQQF